MAKNEVAKKENTTPSYNSNNYDETHAYDDKVVNEHIEDYGNGVVIDRVIQEHSEVHQKSSRKSK